MSTQRVWEHYSSKQEEQWAPAPLGCPSSYWETSRKLRFKYFQKTWQHLRRDTTAKKHTLVEVREKTQSQLHIPKGLFREPPAYSAGMTGHDPQWLL